MTDLDKQIDEIFPTWFKKLQVTFSGELPSSKGIQQQVFVVPYAMFTQAIKALISEETILAKINEAQNAFNFMQQLLLEEDDSDEVVGKFQIECRKRIAELNSITKETK